MNIYCKRLIKEGKIQLMYIIKIFERREHLKKENYSFLREMKFHI